MHNPSLLWPASKALRVFRDTSEPGQAAAKGGTGSAQAPAVARMGNASAADCSFRPGRLQHGKNFHSMSAYH